MIQAKVIADSQNQFGNRITTMIVTMPRYILAEFNTHRMLSKNSASSRAIPFEKLLKSVEENPFIPIAWMKDHKGMQGTEFFTDEGTIRFLKSGWLKARDKALNYAKVMSEEGLTKQLCNRLLEPFMWHTVIVTGTEWENFFALRCPKYEMKTNHGNIHFRSRASYNKASLEATSSVFTGAFTDWLSINSGQADIHMMATAEAMWDAMNESKPVELKEGEWHIPFGDKLDGITNLANYKIDLKVKIATARCARVSYTVVGEEGKPANYENDIKLHDRLAESGHWSPFEHCARAMNESEYSWSKHYDTHSVDRCSEGWSGNFRGFIQYRKMFANENITK